MTPSTTGEERLDSTWQLFAEGIPDILVQLSVDGTILHINRTPPGRMPGDVLGNNVFEFLVPASGTAVRRALDEVFAGGDSRVHEIPMLGDDGRICWFAAHVGPIGLGLATVSALVRSHEGTIGVTSRVGEGTTFEVVFPPTAITEPLEML